MKIQYLLSMIIKFLNLLNIAKYFTYFNLISAYYLFKI